MLVKEMIEDLEFVLKKYPGCDDFRIAFEDEDKDNSEGTNVIYVEAFHWDEEEFFIVPVGCGKFFDLKPQEMTVSNLLNALKQIDQEILEFPAYARADAGELPDKTTVSLNYPLMGVGISQMGKTVYFLCRE